MVEQIASLRPFLAILVSAVAIIFIFSSSRYPNLRDIWTILAALLKFGIVASMVPGVLSGKVYVTNFGEFLPGVKFALQVDSLGLLFGFLASLLWIATSFYSIGYMRGLNEHSQTRYFAAFAASLSSTLGVAFASNLFVLYIFYELLTVSTYPLVVHDETNKAKNAGKKYLVYTFGGGIAVLAGSILVFWITGTTDFSPGGLAMLAGSDPILTRIAFGLLIMGFGVKAALMPFHSWLPDAMVAPTPVSGLLHAVAVVKSGVFGIARVILDIFGPDLISNLGLDVPLSIVAALTILIASIIALRQDNLKRLLAFSTISQLSYIILGLVILDPYSILGGLLHIPAHAFMKLTLFFCAGAIHVETNTDYISEMAGIGKRMPLTMSAFTIAAAGMAGIPLVAGFVSKYLLLIGSVSSGNIVFAVVFLVSGILNIAYFWPVIYTSFFKSQKDRSDPLIPVSDNLNDMFSFNNFERAIKNNKTTVGSEWKTMGWSGEETTWFMLAPILFSVLGAVVLGIAPDLAVFLRIIRLIVSISIGVVV